MSVHAATVRSHRRYIAKRLWIASKRALLHLPCSIGFIALLDGALCLTCYDLCNSQVGCKLTSVMGLMIQIPSYDFPPDTYLRPKTVVGHCPSQLR